MKHVVMIACLLAAPALAQDDPVFGRWLVQTEKGVVEIYPCGASACGKLVWVENPDKKDIHNENEGRRGDRICNATMLQGFEKVGSGAWENGEIYNAEDGKTYSAEMEVKSDGKLHLRGYVGLPIFGKTNVWTRTDREPNCG